VQSSFFLFNNQIFFKIIGKLDRKEHQQKKSLIIRNRTTTYYMFRFVLLSFSCSFV